MVSCLMGDSTALASAIVRCCPNSNERGLLPFPVILAATKGDPDAMKIVLQHYQSYIAHLSMKKIRDENGNTYWGIDEDLRERLQTKLMQAVLNFKIYRD